MNKAPVPAWMFVTGLGLSVYCIVVIEIEQNNSEWGMMKKGGAYNSKNV